MSKQEDVHRPEKPLEKTREIDNEARISKEAKMTKKFNRNQDYYCYYYYYFYSFHESGFLSHI